MDRNRKIIVFSVLFVFIHILLYIVFYFLANKNNALVLAEKDFKKMDENVELLFLGDSHVVRGINMSAFKHSYSLAYYGENNVMCYYRLKNILDSNLPRPKYVALPCDVFTFSKGVYMHRTKRFFYYSFIPFSELKEFEEPPMFLSYYNYFKTKAVPYCEWASVVSKQNLKKIQKGFRRFSDVLPSKRVEVTHNFIQKELRCEENKKNLFYERSLNYLKKTIKLCEENNIKLFYIKYPLSDEIFDEIENHVDNRYIKNRPSENILNGNDIPIIDMEYVFRNNQELFFDSHHLNEFGKAKFTPILKKSIDSLLQVY